MAFYIWADTSAISADSAELCRTWLSELSVAATPGIDFDPGEGHHWVRFSLAGSTATIAEAARRLRRWRGC